MSELRHDQPVIGILGYEDKLSARWVVPFANRGIGVKIIEPRQNLNASEALNGLSGLLLPGGDANVHPHFVSREIPRGGDLYDYDRDFSAINLVRHAYDHNLPTIGICRGMQEMVASYGGALQKLEQEIHAKGYQYRDESPDDPCAIDQPVHPITFTEHGVLYPLFRELCDEQRRIVVNSVHYEGITEDGWNSIQSVRLRNIFQIEATADDGVIEAMSAPERDFFIGVQAHFECEGLLHNALFDDLTRHIRNHFENSELTATPAEPALDS